MTRDCQRCGFTLPLACFAPSQVVGWRVICRDCWSANAVIWRVAGIAADGLVRLRAIDALLGLGYVRAARLIACGLISWPSVRELREGRRHAPSAVVVDLVRRRHDRSAADAVAHA